MPCYVWQFSTAFLQTRGTLLTPEALLEQRTWEVYKDNELRVFPEIILPDFLQAHLVNIVP